MVSMSGDVLRRQARRGVSLATEDYQTRAGFARRGLAGAGARQRLFDLPLNLPAELDWVGDAIEGLGRTPGAVHRQRSEAHHPAEPRLRDVDALDLREHQLDRVAAE